MGQTCSVYGCSGWQGLDNIKFFNMSAIIKHHNDPTTMQPSENHCKAWLTSINRRDWEPTKNSCVCSIHFISGIPSSLYDSSKPDWVPTLKMGAASLKHKSGSPKCGCYECLKARSAKKCKLEFTKTMCTANSSDCNLILPCADQEEIIENVSYM